MFDVRANYFENILTITGSGKSDLPEIQKSTQAIIKNARSLHPGFVMITDIRALAPAVEEGRLEIQTTLKNLREMGMAMEIRIVSDENMVTANQFQRTSRSVGYTATEVRSLVEAERILDELS